MQNSDKIFESKHSICIKGYPFGSSRISLWPSFLLQMQHSWFITSIFMERGMKQVHLPFQRSAMGGSPTTTAFCRMTRWLWSVGTYSSRKEDKKQHSRLTPGGRRQPQNMFRVARSVFVKIKVNTATGKNSSQYFISQCPLGSVVFSWGKHLPVCHRGGVDKSLSRALQSQWTVLLSVDQSVPLPNAATRDVLGKSQLGGLLQCPRAQTWNRRKPAPEFLHKSWTRHF